MSQDARRLGTFGGVFTPSILTILGVIMYLRFGWVLGSVGLLGCFAVVVLAHLISAATGLSVSSIATNKTVGAGGAYFMISRSLGAPAGASVGIPLFFAQALSVTFYVVGFTESLNYLLPDSHPNAAIDLLLNTRVMGTLTLGLITLVGLKSAEAAIKVQYVVMAAIGLSLISLFLGDGGAAKPTSIELAGSTAPEAGSFMMVFAVFFPAVTGIMAGVSMSGDLKDARRSLPRGTMAAIGAGFVIYMAIPIYMAAQATNDAMVLRPDIMFSIALFPSLIYLGVWGATLSSAVGSILAAPRTLQALAADGLAPRIFAKGAGPANEPRNGLIFTFLLAEVGVLLGDLNMIAPILTMFFLTTYGVINLACALERWAANPSFRPTFKVPTLVSFGGFLACFYVMSIINMGAMIAAALVCGIIYAYFQRRDLNTTFGDARHGIWSAVVRTALHRLHRVEFHALNWRPNVLVFGGAPDKRPQLLDLGAMLVQERGIVSYVQMLPGDVLELGAERRQRHRELAERLQERHPNVFSRVDVVPEVYRGMVTVSQSYGIGPLEANTVIAGWLNRGERAESYFQMLRELHTLYNSLLLLRYDTAKGFGRRRSIHVWWGGLQANGPLMLLLAYLLKSDKEWREAQVVALTVVNAEDEKLVAEQGLEAIFEDARLEGEARVILRNGESIVDIMARESAHSDLVVMGFTLPEEPGEGAALFERYTTLLARLPTTILVNSGKDFEGAPVLFDK